jgi:hypothetical protein
MIPISVAFLAPVHRWFTEGFDTRESEGSEGVAGGVGGVE